MQVRESRETLCFPTGLWPRGSKSMLAKAAGAEPSGQMRHEKLPAVVARSTWKSKCTKHSLLGARLEVDIEKVHASLVQSKFPGRNSLSEVDMSKKCTPLWREARFQVKGVKHGGVQNTFGRSSIVCLAGARDYAPCQ